MENSRRARRHLQRAQELLNGHQLGFGEKIPDPEVLNGQLKCVMFKIMRQNGHVYMGSDLCPKNVVIPVKYYEKPGSKNIIICKNDESDKEMKKYLDTDFATKTINFFMEYAKLEGKMEDWPVVQNLLSGEWQRETVLGEARYEQIFELPQRGEFVVVELEIDPQLDERVQQGSNGPHQKIRRQHRLGPYARESKHTDELEELNRERGWDELHKYCQSALQKHNDTFMNINIDEKLKEYKSYLYNNSSKNSYADVWYWIKNEMT